MPYEGEIRCYVRGPDGHPSEVGPLLQKDVTLMSEDSFPTRTDRALRAGTLLSEALQLELGEAERNRPHRFQNTTPV